ncbi:Glutamate Receptor Ionotropic, Nmda 3A [Manis pentadactyla]|nr:Glutamate Receptor Ionotropic, Nmda 3A [Manis pentadactyla]
MKSAKKRLRHKLCGAPRPWQLGSGKVSAAYQNPGPSRAPALPPATRRSGRVRAGKREQRTCAKAAAAAGEPSPVRLREDWDRREGREGVRRAPAPGAAWRGGGEGRCALSGAAGGAVGGAGERTPSRRRNLRRREALVPAAG